MAKKKIGSWGIAVVVAALAIGALLYLTVQPAPKVSPTVSKPTSARPTIRTVALGSYGSAVHRNGLELALQIHPLAELKGPAGESPPSLAGPVEQEIIGNIFLRFADLPSLTQDSAAQKRLASEIRAQLNAQLGARHSPWRIRSLQLRPSLGPIPTNTG